MRFLNFFLLLTILSFPIVSFAETVSYKISVTIPAIIGVNTPSSENINADEYDDQKFLTETITEEIIKDGQKFIIHTIVIKE